jgi:hypothetical protein
MEVVIYWTTIAFSGSTVHARRRGNDAIVDGDGSRRRAGDLERHDEVAKIASFGNLTGLPITFVTRIRPEQTFGFDLQQNVQKEN